jgi:hypothetical protein
MADAKTLKTIAGLGQIMATTKECAAVLGVSEPTFIKFMRRPAVREVFEQGQGKRLTSLRRAQFRAADKGNATMLIWLGKQHLGQNDGSKWPRPGSDDIDAPADTVTIVVRGGLPTVRPS